MNLPPETPPEIWADYLEEQGLSVEEFRAWLLWGAVFHGEGTFDTDLSIYNGDAEPYGTEGDFCWEMGVPFELAGNGCHPYFGPDLGDGGTEDFMRVFLRHRE